MSFTYWGISILACAKHLKKLGRQLITALVIVTIASACSDHLPPSAQRFRLKTMERNDSIGNITFSYDSKNRVSSFVTQTGSAYYILYDDQSRPVLIERYPDIKNQGYEVFYSFYYSSNNNDFTMTTTVRNERDVDVKQLNEYTVDSQKRITGFKELNKLYSNGIDREYLYNYTDGNSTLVTTITGNQVTTAQFEYDAKPNPLYGMPGPGTFLGFVTFSRNNITKGSETMPGGDLKTSFEYTYEYNELGFPLSATNKNGPERFRYIYETY